MSKETEGYDVGDRNAVKKRRKKVKLQEEELEEAIRKVLETYPGRLFVWSMLEQAGIYHTTFDQDASLAAFREGMRQSGLQLLAQVDKVDPNAYSKMRDEAVKRKEKQ